jgi:hypothetical protein
MTWVGPPTVRGERRGRAAADGRQRGERGGTACSTFSCTAWRLERAASVGSGTAAGVGRGGGTRARARRARGRASRLARAPAGGEHERGRAKGAGADDLEGDLALFESGAQVHPEESGGGRDGREGRTDHTQVHVGAHLRGGGRRERKADQQRGTERGRHAQVQLCVSRVCVCVCVSI